MPKFHFENDDFWNNMCKKICEVSRFTRYFSNVYFDRTDFYNSSSTTVKKITYSNGKPPLKSGTREVRFNGSVDVVPLSLARRIRNEVNNQFDALIRDLES